MRFPLSTICSTAALIALAGCSAQNSAEESAEESTEVLAYEGVVIDGYLQGATVCADLNSNGACDSNEPSVTTNALGEYQLTVPTRFANVEIIASIDENTIDSDDGKAVATRYILRTLPGKEHIFTPLTTLVQLRLESENLADEALVIEQIKAELGLDESVDLFTDYIKPATAAYKKAHQKARLIAQVEKALNKQLATLGFNERESIGTSWIKHDIIMEHLALIDANDDESNLESVAQQMVEGAITFKNYGEIRRKIAHYSALHKLKRLQRLSKRIDTNVSSDAIVSALQDGGLYSLHHDFAPSYDETFVLRITQFEDADADMNVQATSTWYDSSLQSIADYRDANRSFYLLQKDGWTLTHRNLTQFALSYEYNASLILNNEANESFLAEPLAQIDLSGRYFGARLTRYSHEPHSGTFSSGAKAYTMRYTSLQDRYIVRPFILQSPTHIDTMFALRGSAVDTFANVIVPDANATQTFSDMDSFLTYFAYDEGNLSQPFAPAPFLGGVTFSSNGVAYYKAPYGNVLAVGSYTLQDVQGEQVLILSFETPFTEGGVKRQLMFSVIQGKVKVGAYVPAGKRYHRTFNLYNRVAYDDFIAALSEESAL